MLSGTYRWYQTNFCFAIIVCKMNRGLKFYLVVNDGSTEYYCTLCKDVFHHIRQVLYHRKVHHSARYVVIVKAKVVATVNNAGSENDQDEKNQKSLSCLCGQQFATDNEYHEHRSSCESIMCQYCGITCNEYDMYGHMLFKHKEIKTFKCHLCGYTVNSSMKYVNHLNLRHEKHNNVFKCSEDNECSQSNETRNDVDVFSTEIEQLSWTFPTKKVFKKYKKNQKYPNTFQRNTSNEHLDLLEDTSAHSKCIQTTDEATNNINNTAINPGNDSSSCSKNDTLALDNIHNENLEEVDKLDSDLPMPKNAKKKNNVTCICYTCGKIFTRWIYLTRHLKIHQGVRNFLCYKCGKRFTTNLYLKRHLLIVHSNHRRYKCHICEMNFKTSFQLKRHVMWHTGQKPYKCQFCNKQCIQKCNLERHVCKPPK